LAQISGSSSAAVRVYCFYLRPGVANYNLIRERLLKKTDFAMTVLSANADWEVSNYIVDGLRWLEFRLHGPVEETTNQQ